MQANRKDLGAGLFFASAGAVYGAIAVTSLPIGEPLEMGPGFFPLMLATLLVLLGAAIALRSRRTTPRVAWSPTPWRAVVMVSFATVVFALTFRSLGILPSVFLTSLAAALSSRQINVVRALVTAAGVAVFCTLVFGFGLRLPVPVVALTLY